MVEWEFKKLFKTKRFGAFIHFGIYSVNAWHEQDQLRRRIPKEEYVKLQQIFNPWQFNADEWVGFLREAGAEYICFTAKHHDGFCMWDTKETDYKITNTPFKRDILKEIADACERHGMYLEIYYSCPDWHHKNSVNDGSESHKLPKQNEGDEPDDELYVEYVKRQVSELLTGYGKIHAFFWDIPPKRRDESVNKLVRKLQPDILINDRGYDKGDYSTPERDACIKNANFDRLCEACQSVGAMSWGYRYEEDYFTSQSLIAGMSDIFIKGGNYLLNIGPMPNGIIPERSAEIFKKCAGWYKRIRESIIDTEFLRLGGFNYTLRRNENALYLHLPAAYCASGARLAPIVKEPECAIILNTGKPVRAVCEYTPHDFDNKKNAPHLHIRDIPANELLSENIVIKLRYENISEALCGLGIDNEVIL